MKKLIVGFLIVSSILNFNASYSKENISSKKETTKKSDEKSEEKKKKVEIVESEYQPVLLGALLEDPKNYLDKKIKIRGKFSSFTTLALDYEPALRKSKDHISISIFRPDTMIPLSELKLAYPLSEAKENQVIRDLEEGDLLEIYGQVFSAALGEPWVDITSIKSLEKTKEKVAETKKEESSVKSKKNKNSKTK